MVRMVLASGKIKQHAAYMFEILRNGQPEDVQDLLLLQSETMKNVKKCTNSIESVVKSFEKTLEQIQELYQCSQAKRGHAEGKIRDINKQSTTKEQEWNNENLTLNKLNHDCLELKGQTEQLEKDFKQRVQEMTSFKTFCATLIEDVSDIFRSGNSPRKERSRVINVRQQVQWSREDLQKAREQKRKSEQRALETKLIMANIQLNLKHLQDEAVTQEQILQVLRNGLQLFAKIIEPWNKLLAFFKGLTVEIEENMTGDETMMKARLEDLQAGRKSLLFLPRRLIGIEIDKSLFP